MNRLPAPAQPVDSLGQFFLRKAKAAHAGFALYGNAQNAPGVAMGGGAFKLVKVAHHRGQALHGRSLPFHIGERAQKRHNGLPQASLAQGHAF